KQFSQVKGVVEAITEGSRQLKSALEDGKKIIITTIQKFPYICSEISELGAHKFAIIIDEAHSSQSGETAAKMNLALATDKEEFDIAAEPDVQYETEIDFEDYFDTEDLINQIISQRKMLKNASILISFFINFGVQNIINRKYNTFF
ncbi:MAG: hypothetical protein KJ607_14490, partial [Bacteroidetes bacterium]|nr:hypothetical protein [Bacteroidota bacterium]